ncbi:MAG: alpha/beta hydrolase [Ginsengibacter sp.]
MNQKTFSKYFIKFSICLFFCVPPCVFAQPVKLKGTWEGKINAGVDLRVVFHFAIDSTGNLSGTTDSPDQGVKGVACSDINVAEDSVHLAVKAFGATYNGKLINDTTITGQLTQGRSIDLILKKVLKVSTYNRPQTPSPPFSYTSEEVEFENVDSSLHYGATLTIPPGKGPFPAVLLITGSGAQNRDEEILEHKPFLVIADALTKRGILVMRVDDRGVGKSSGSFKNASSADFAADVNTSLNYLISRPETDHKHLGMIGHSEGGMIAPMVAVKRKDINFIILLAGPGEKGLKLMEEQNVALLRSAGFSQEAAEDYRSLYHSLATGILKSKNNDEAKKNAYAAVDDWKKITPEKIVVTTTGIHDDSTEKKFVDLTTEAFNSAWFRYFLQFDPTQYLSKLTCKVLALNGEKDVQVQSSTNLAGIRSALAKSKSLAYEAKEIPGLNHLFQHCKRCTVAEYGQLEETFAPEVLHLIGDWILKNVK